MRKAVCENSHRLRRSIAERKAVCENSQRLRRSIAERNVARASIDQVTNWRVLTSPHSCVGAAGAKRSVPRLRSRVNPGARCALPRPPIVVLDKRSLRCVSLDFPLTEPAQDPRDFREQAALARADACRKGAACQF
jgi:hypothetical protein